MYFGRLRAIIVDESIVCIPANTSRNDINNSSKSGDASLVVNTLRPRRNEQHFADDIFKRIFFNENVWISIKISLKFVPKGPINNIPALVQIMAWRRWGDKPLSEPIMVSLPTHICVTRPQWVNLTFGNKFRWHVYKSNDSRKWFWECRLQNGHHFVSTPMCNSYFETFWCNEYVIMC